jgi:hypothetical protein
MNISTSPSRLPHSFEIMPLYRLHLCRRSEGKRTRRVAGALFKSQNEPFRRTLPIMLPAALSTAATATPIFVFPEVVLVQFLAVLSQ